MTAKTVSTSIKAKKRCFIFILPATRLHQHQCKYLKEFLKEEAEHFQFLFDSANNFWIGELMTDEILRTVNEIVKKEEPGTMKSFYYKIKAMNCFSTCLKV